MKHTNPTTCPKCSYIRKETDNVPLSECPNCGIYYEKYEAIVAARSASATATTNEPNDYISTTPNTLSPDLEVRSSPRKWMVKKIPIFIVVASILVISTVEVGGLISRKAKAIELARPIADIEKDIEQMDKLKLKFNDAVAVSKNTMRFALTSPISSMQQIRQQTEQYQPISKENCIIKSHKALLDTQNKWIEYFLSFMRNADVTSLVAPPSINLGACPNKLESIRRKIDAIERPKKASYSITWNTPLAIPAQFLNAYKFGEKFAIVEGSPMRGNVIKGAGVIDRNGDWVFISDYGSVNRVANDEKHFKHCDTDYGLDGCAIFDIESGASFFLTNSIQALHLENSERKPIFSKIEYSINSIVVGASPIGSDHFGIIDFKGEWKVKPWLKKIGTFVDNLAAAQKFKVYATQTWVIQEDKWGVINESEQWIVPSIYDSLGDKYRSSDKFRQASLNGTNGFISDNAEWVIKTSHTETGMFFNFGVLNVKANEKWGFIDKTGTQVIAPIYDEVGIPFAENRFNVRVGEYWGILDSKEQWIISPTFEELRLYGDEGEAKQGGKWGFIDSKGKWTVTPRFEELGYISEKLAVAKSKGKFGFVDAKGRWIVEPRFENAQAFSNGMAAVMLDGKWGYIETPNALRWMFRSLFF